MSLMPFKGRCIHCGYDHGNSDFYGDDPIRYQDRLKAQATLEKVAVHVLEQQIAALTRQGDLAVGALEDVRKELQQSNDRLNEEREIWDRVMGDGVKKLERLELELDDCLYVLESLWDKTCNKEVTEKWAGILIRNKRGIGASSAEDSSEQTTA